VKQHKGLWRQNSLHWLKIAIQLHPVTESCIICSSRSRRPVRKLLDTPSCDSTIRHIFSRCQPQGSPYKTAHRLGNGTSKGIRPSTMCVKIYWGNGGVAPRILNLGTRLRRVVRLTPRGKQPQYLLDKRLGGPQSRSERGGEEKNFYYCLHNIKYRSFKIHNLYLKCFDVVHKNYKQNFWM
jgi:hypothetical protein